MGRSGGDAVSKGLLSGVDLIMKTRLDFTAVLGTDPRSGMIIACRALNDVLYSLSTVFEFRIAPQFAAARRGNPGLLQHDCGVSERRPAGGNFDFEEEFVFCCSFYCTFLLCRHEPSGIR